MSKYTEPDYTTQDSSTYKANIDNGFNTFSAGSGINFQPHEQDTPDMTIILEAGMMFNISAVTLTSVIAQSCGTITAPASNPRIDRVIINQTTGAVSVITGSEAVTPTAPSFTSGSFPIAQILLATSSTEITDSMITDERPSAFVVSAAGMSNIVEDTTPQLGGSLDVNSKEILSVGATDIDLHSGRNIIAELGDASGTNKISVKDSGAVEVASIDSDGDVICNSVTVTNPIVGTSIDIHTTTAETTVADADEILIYDATAGVNKRMTKANLVSGIGGQTVAWVHCNSAGTILDSFGISNVVHNATGDYSINITAGIFANADYGYMVESPYYVSEGVMKAFGIHSISTKTTSTFRLLTLKAEYYSTTTAIAFSSQDREFTITFLGGQ